MLCNICRNNPWKINSLVNVWKSWKVETKNVVKILKIMKMTSMKDDLTDLKSIDANSAFLLFSLSPTYYFSPIRGCPRVMKIYVCTIIRVKLDEKWLLKNGGPPLQKSRIDCNLPIKTICLAKTWNDPMTHSFYLP